MKEPGRAGTPLAYEPCPCWLDDHLQVLFPAGGPPAGASYEVAYRVAAWPDDGAGREGAAALAWRSLATGALDMR